MSLYNEDHRRTNPAIRCVIFDMDGLLLDTEPIYTEAMREVVGVFGKSFDMTLKAEIIGRPAMESASYMVDMLDLPISAGEFLSRRNRLLEQRFPAAESKPGARTLVAHLDRHAVPMAVATSSPRDLVNLKIMNHQDWFEAFTCIVSVEDEGVPKGKPEPDVYLTAAQKLGADPRTCLAFEDSPAGVRSAHAAGMPVVAVPELDPAHESFQFADQILSSLALFRPDEWGLPPF